MTDVFIGEFSTLAIELTSLSQGVVEDDGGYPITITGVFREEVAAVYLVRGADQIPCYSARSGQGYRPFPRSPTTLQFATPPLPLGGAAWDVKVVQGAFEAVLSAAVTVVARNWHDRSLALRRVLPPWYKLGPRYLDSVDLLV